jgi:hypothetical protein
VAAECNSAMRLKKGAAAACSKSKQNLEAYSSTFIALPGEITQRRSVRRVYCLESGRARRSERFQPINRGFTSVKISKVYIAMVSTSHVQRQESSVNV